MPEPMFFYFSIFVNIKVAVSVTNDSSAKGIEGGSGLV
jgi:hypothetical protein